MGTQLDYRVVTLGIARERYAAAQLLLTLAAEREAYLRSFTGTLSNRIVAHDAVALAQEAIDRAQDEITKAELSISEWGRDNEATRDEVLAQLGHRTTLTEEELETTVRLATDWARDEG